MRDAAFLLSNSNFLFFFFFCYPQRFRKKIIVYSIFDVILWVFFRKKKTLCKIEKNLSILNLLIFFELRYSCVVRQQYNNTVSQEQTFIPSDMSTLFCDDS